MKYRFIFFFCLTLAAFHVHAQTETRAERSAQALEEQTPGKLFEQRLQLLEQAIEANDAAQMLSLQRDLLMAIRESMASPLDSSARQALEKSFSTLETFSFHEASASECQSALSVLKSVRMLIH